MKNFDRFVGIDWSGAKIKSPSRTISVAMSEHENAAPVLVKEKWTRPLVYEWIKKISKDNKRTLIGIDCNLSYSHEIGDKQFGSDYNHMHLWNSIQEICQGAPDFFAGNFWKHPNNIKYFWENGKMPKNFLMPRRLTETACAQAKMGIPESPFKLLGPKQVGKGGLAGMRMVLHLKNLLGDKIEIWPFEVQRDKAFLVMTEIYPRLFLKLSGHGDAKVRTLDQLNLVLSSLQTPNYQANKPFSDHDADAIVSAAGLRYLCGKGNNVPEEIAYPNVPKTILAKEGWIFGVK